MIFRASREARDDRFLELKAALLVAGATLGLAGMVSERSWLVWLGIGVIAVALIVRLAASRTNHGDPK